MTAGPDAAGRDHGDRRAPGLVVGSAGSSTVLDTVLFVLLVGAAVGVLATADTGDHRERASVTEETADVLSTSTTRVAYSQSYTVIQEGLLGTADRRRVTIRRTAGGTHAELLAAAAAAVPTVAGTALVMDEGEFEEAVRPNVRRALPTETTNVQVRAVWRPYEEGPPGGTVVVGDTPPRDADLSVATTAVPSGFPNVTAAAVQGARSGGYDDVAAAVADGVVQGLFPPAQTRAALYSEGPELVATAARYRRASDRLAVETRTLVERRDVHAANERLAGALADRLRRELRRTFDSPRAAARAVRIDRVRLVVRTWSP